MSGYRRLVVGDPQAHRPRLADALSSQALALYWLDRDAEAVPLITEAVRIMRPLGTEQPLEHGLFLAFTLRTQAEVLAEVDRQQEAVTAVDEAVRVCEGLVNQQESEAHTEALEEAREVQADIAGTQD